MKKDPILFDNGYWAVALNEQGCITSIADKLNCVTHMIRDYGFTLVTDYGEIHTADVSAISRPVVIKAGEQEILFEYSYACCDVCLEYRFSQGNVYFERFLHIKAHDSPLFLLKILAGKLSFAESPTKVFQYNTFWNCPTVTFFRWPKAGLFAGFANPFFETLIDQDGVRFGYEPAILLNADKSYLSDAQFIGCIQLTNKYIQEESPKTSLYLNKRYHTRYRNPQGHIPLDIGESRAFSKYAYDYLSTDNLVFQVVYYMFWTPIRQYPVTQGEIKDYFRVVDQAKALHCDKIIFNPLFKYPPPSDDEGGCWNLAPKGSAAETILNYARESGLEIGIYMGSAAGNSYHCNSIMVPYALENQQQWKKVDYTGAVSTENCLAEDSFFQWFHKVQYNTIKKYDLKVWNWDPGPGNGSFCYSTRHSHLPGKGNYAGWRNAMEMMRKLKEEIPGLYYQGFHGTKEFGLWGQKYTDQHEAYWEQKPQQMANLMPDFSAERLTADGVRFQSWWCQNFRFLPARLNHAIVHRMNQSCTLPSELGQLFDYAGYPYAVMSALAVGASLTIPIMPPDFDSPRGKEYVAFMDRWIKWARDTWDYTKYSVVFGSQVCPGSADGTARIRGNEGFLFLCNPNPRPTRISFELNAEIGLDIPGDYALEYLFPWEGGSLCDSETGSYTFAYGSRVTETIPSYQVILLRLRPREDNECILIGRGGSMVMEGRHARIIGVKGLPGVTRSYHVRPPCSSLEVNGIEMDVTSEDGLTTAVVQFDGTALPRNMDMWESEDGTPCPTPGILPAGITKLNTRYYASSVIKELLEASQPDDLPDHSELISSMRIQFPYDSFLWAQPYRLFLTLPFVDAEQVDSIDMKLNGETIPVSKVIAETYGIATCSGWYADITESTIWNAENRVELAIICKQEAVWMGPSLCYPEQPETTLVVSGKHTEKEPVFTGERAGLQKRRHPPAEGERYPIVTAAWTDGPFTSYGNTTLYASINLPFDDVEGVYLSAQITIGTHGRKSAYSDLAMKFNPDLNVWFYTVQMGRRNMLILDAPMVYVWVVSKNGTIGDIYSIPIQWRLST